MKNIFIFMAIMIGGCGWIDEQLGSIVTTKVTIASDGGDTTTTTITSSHTKRADDNDDNTVMPTNTKRSQIIQSKSLNLIETETSILPSELSSIVFNATNLMIAGRNSNGHQTTVYKNTNGDFSIQDQVFGIAAGSISAEGNYLAIAGRQYVGDWVPTIHIFKKISGTYQPDPQSIVATQYGDIKLAYLNNDSYPDLIVTGDINGTSITKIYFNNAGTFVDSNQATIPAFKNSSISVGDVDNDGSLDILIAGETSTGSQTYLYLNTESGFQLVASFAGIKNGEVFLVDLNGDQHLDVIEMGQSVSGNIVKAYINTGSLELGFDEIESLLPAVRTHDGNQTFSSRGIAMGDLNNDGYSDLVATGVGTDNMGMTKVFLNDGTGHFNEFMSLEPVVSGSVAIGDIDGDEDLDIILVGRAGVPISKVYLNDWND